MAKSQKKLEKVLKLEIEEVLKLERNSQEVEILQKETLLQKSLLDKKSLEILAIDAELELNKLQLEKLKRELIEHGKKTMLKENSATDYVDMLKQKYNVLASEFLAYDPDTFLISKE
jgi:hypothetical protein